MVDVVVVDHGSVVDLLGWWRWWSTTIGWAGRSAHWGCALVAARNCSSLFYKETKNTKDTSVRISRSLSTFHIMKLPRLFKSLEILAINLNHDRKRKMVFFVTSNLLTRCFKCFSSTILNLANTFSHFLWSDIHSSINLLYQSRKLFRISFVSINKKKQLESLQQIVGCSVDFYINCYIIRGWAVLF